MVGRMANFPDYNRKHAKKQGDEKMNLTYEEIMERIDLLTDELSKIKRALQAVNEGIPFTESFNEELFEERADLKDAMSQMITMMHHLLKFRFCTTDRAKRGWFTRSIYLPRREIINDIEWRPLNRSYNKSVVKRISQELQTLYDNAKTNYIKDAKQYGDLKYGLQHLPEKCPWTLIDLVDGDYVDLLKMIPRTNDSIDPLDGAIKKIVELDPENEED